MLIENYIKLLIVLFLFSIVFGLAELLYKRKIASYVTRKIVHIGCGLVAGLLPFFVNLKTVVILGLGFFLLLLFSKRKKVLNSIHEIDEDSIGALLFPPSIALTALIFWPINTLIFQGAILILGLSDGLAGLFGRRYGKKVYRVFGNKTIEGSLLFFFITVIILCAILYIDGDITYTGFMFVFGGSFFLTAIEAVFSKGWDNLFVPIASGIVLYFIL